MPVLVGARVCVLIRFHFYLCSVPVRLLLVQ